ncbi:MAG TPA: RNA-binding protein [Ktedonobacterales bacterium]|nr:RNA-binding protein [Ktedonobacterales bacterium]
MRTRLQEREASNDHADLCWKSPYTVDNAQLTQLFGSYGEVVDAHVVTDRDTGRSKGFGFIEMANEETMRQAITGLNGTLLGTQTLTVNEARPRADQDRRGR